MAFDLDAFLKDLGATGEEETTLRAALGKPERLTLLEQNQLRQSDFSKNSNALKAEQTKLSQASDRLTAEMAEWAKIQAEGGEVTKKMRDDLDKAQQKVLTLTQRVERVATEAGLDPAKALEGIDQVVPPKKDEPAPIDMSKYVSAEQFAAMMNWQVDLATELPMIAQEHFDLTGERLDTRAFKSEIAERAKNKNANLDPRAVWEDKYQIQPKREAKTQAARTAEIQQAEQRGFERARTEAALPTPSAPGQHSPLLKTVGEGHTSKLQRPAPEKGIASAAAALQSGKYREQPAGAGAK